MDVVIVECFIVTFKSRKCVVVDGVFASHVKFPQLYNLNGRTPYEIVTGGTPEISEYLDYGWYDNLWYYDQEAAFPNDQRKLGKWLGVTH